jgi:hypothetical protein
LVLFHLVELFDAKKNKKLQPRSIHHNIHFFPCPHASPAMLNKPTGNQAAKHMLLERAEYYDPPSTRDLQRPKLEQFSPISTCIQRFKMTSSNNYKW